MIHCEPDDRVLAGIVRSPGATLDDVVFQCPDLMWNQVFLDIDRLSRKGVVRVIAKSPGVYTLRLSWHVGAPNMASELGGR